MTTEQREARRQASALARQLQVIVISKLPCYRQYHGYERSCLEAEIRRLCPVCMAIVKRAEG